MLILAFLASLILGGLKLAGVIAVSWFVVALPLAATVVLMLVYVLVFVAFLKLVTKRLF